MERVVSCFLTVVNVVMSATVYQMKLKQMCTSVFTYARYRYGIIYVQYGAVQRTPYSST
jgi:hypothetical protein